MLPNFSFRDSGRQNQNYGKQKNQGQIKLEITGIGAVKITIFRNGWILKPLRTFKKDTRQGNM